MDYIDNTEQKYYFVIMYPRFDLSVLVQLININDNLNFDYLKKLKKKNDSQKNKLSTRIFLVLGSACISIIYVHFRC